MLQIITIKRKIPHIQTLKSSVLKIRQKSMLVAEETLDTTQSLRKM